MKTNIKFALVCILLAVSIVKSDYLSLDAGSSGTRLYTVSSSTFIATECAVVKTDAGKLATVLAA